MKAISKIEYHNDEAQIKENSLSEAVFILAQSIKTLNDLNIKKELSEQRAEEQNRKIKSKIISFLSKGNLIASIISIMLASLVSGGVYVYKNIQNNFDELRDQAIGLIIIDTEADTICHNLVVNPYDLNDFEKKAIWDIHGKMRDQYSEFLKSRSKLGKYISSQNYMQAAALIYWNTQLITSGTNLCQLSTKNTARLLKWRNDLVGGIQKDKERHQQILTFLKDYGNYLGSWFFLNRPLSEQSYKPYEEPEFMKLQKIIDLY